jgi:adenylate kinase
MRRKLPNIIITGTPSVGKTTTCTQLVSLAADIPAASSSKTESGLWPMKLRHLSINQLVKEKGCHERWDEEMKSWIVDEEMLGDEVENVLGVSASDGEGVEEGGWLIDWHACDLFSRSWVDLVVVLRCERTEVMWDRLKARCVSLSLITTVGFDRPASLQLNALIAAYMSDFSFFPCRDYPEAKLQENLDAEIFGVLVEEAKEAFDEEMVVELKSETAEDVDENCERILQWIQTWRENQRRKGFEEEGSS